MPARGTANAYFSPFGGGTDTNTNPSSSLSPRRPARPPQQVQLCLPRLFRPHPLVLPPDTARLLPAPQVPRQVHAHAVQSQRTLGSRRAVRRDPHRGHRDRRVGVFQRRRQRSARQRWRRRRGGRRGRARRSGRGCRQRAQVETGRIVHWQERQRVPDVYSPTTDFFPPLHPSRLSLVLWLGILLPRILPQGIRHEPDGSFQMGTKTIERRGQGQGQDWE